MSRPAMLALQQDGSGDRTSRHTPPGSRPQASGAGLVASLAGVALNRHCSEPLYRQLYAAIRKLVISHALLPGMRLPSTRALAREFRVSRNTVLAAFDQLRAEGYTDGDARAGAGTRVSQRIPEDCFAFRAPEARPVRVPGASARLSRAGLHYLEGARYAPRGPLRPFHSGLPDVLHFPFDRWSRMVTQSLRSLRTDLLRDPDPLGYRPLRETIARYLQAMRGFSCDPDQIMITSGTSQGIDLALRVLVGAGDAVWLENPGLPGAVHAVRALGAQPIAVNVDDEGIDVDAGGHSHRSARIALVTPSHQYPLGVVMSLQRRGRLLDWAQERDAWIIEDDYDSEFRYSGRPLAALKALDRDDRVLYFGTFSKTLFPTLRLGCVVLPVALVEAFRAARYACDFHTPLLLQPALAEFIEEGHFTAHVRRMRRLYEARQRVLLDSLQRHLGGVLRASFDAAGMHLATKFVDGATSLADVEIAARAEAAGVTTQALSAFYAEPGGAQGLLFGYAAAHEAQIDALVSRLAACVR